MSLEKLMMHISIIPDYRQPWKITHKLSDVFLLKEKPAIGGFGMNSLWGKT